MSTTRKHLRINTKARARRIHPVEVEPNFPINDIIRRVLWDLDNYFERAQYRDRLSDSEGILFDEEGTVTLQLLLKLFNGHCGHPLKFGLRELDQEEIKSEDEEAKGKEEGKESK